MTEVEGDKSPFDEIGGVTLRPDMLDRLALSGLSRRVCKPGTSTQQVERMLEAVAEDDNSVAEPINWTGPPPEMQAKPQ
jgi:hypothetical protein